MKWPKLIARTRLLLLWTPSLVRGDAIVILQKALDGGVDAVQVREKDATTKGLYQLAESARECVRRARALFFVNDRVDVAMACGADGAHLGQDDLPLSLARKIAPPGLLLGMSTHSLEQVRAAADADLLGFGPMFPTITKPREPAIGSADLYEATKIAGKPVFAIGGLDEERILQIGARRAAVSSVILQSADPRDAASRIRRALEQNGSV